MNVASARQRIISFLHLKSKRANKHCAAHLHDSLEKYFARVARDARVPLSRLSFIIGRPCSIAIRPGTGCDTARDAASWRSKGGVKKRFTTSFRRDPFSISSVHRDTCHELHEPVFVFTFSPFPPLPSTFSRTRENSVRFEKPPRNANYRDPPWVKVSSLLERSPFFDRSSSAEF